jgi:hypothetical protein
MKYKRKPYPNYQYTVDDYNMEGYWTYQQEKYGTENSRPINEAMEKIVTERAKGGGDYMDKWWEQQSLIEIHVDKREKGDYLSILLKSPLPDRNKSLVLAKALRERMANTFYGAIINILVDEASHPNQPDRPNAKV